MEIGSLFRSKVRRLVNRFSGLASDSSSKKDLAANVPFTSSGDYWESRYARGGNSGAGSYGVLAEFKAEVINALLVSHNIESAFEFGCGDGHQLGLIKYASYIGFDISPTSVRVCSAAFANDKTKEFRLAQDYKGERADMTLSLDVIYHLVEDEVFDRYMSTLFDAAKKLVVVYSSNEVNSGSESQHVRHRKFTDWVDTSKPNWSQLEKIPNKHPYNGDGTKGSPADFFVYSPARLD